MYHMDHDSLCRNSFVGALHHPKLLKNPSDVQGRFIKEDIVTGQGFGHLSPKLLQECENPTFNKKTHEGWMVKVEWIKHAWDVFGYLEIHKLVSFYVVFLYQNQYLPMVYH